MGRPESERPLRWLDSGHELVDPLETMRTESAAFLGVGSSAT